jgi:hypothetical protein
VSIYQRDPDSAPDSEFEPGELAHLVAGNAGRLLDPRRTPVSIRAIREDAGTFVLRIEGFEDRGALWEVPFEKVSHYQFARGAARTSAAAVARFRDAIARFDRPLAVPCDAVARGRALAALVHERAGAAAWLGAHSDFFAERGELPDPESREGDPRLASDLEAYLGERGLSLMESEFARRYVSNPDSGDLVKGHRIVLAELGLVPYEGKIVRDPAAFDRAWTRAERGRHILARLGFVSAMLARAGRMHVTLYRGVSTEGPLKPPANDTFVSASFSLDVARSHFDSGSPAATRALYRQSVPVERVFMTYLETAAMNRQFHEAEAVLLFDPGNAAF